MPPQDDSKPGCGLPNPDLNPMMNPTLGNNLGLWAQVYFTNPPEKREEAVQQLLRDLETGARPQLMAQSAPATETEPVAPAKTVVAEAAAETTLCPACLHRNDAKQRYCGLCGFTLQAKEQRENAREPITATVARTIERSPDDWQWLHEKNLAELETNKERRSPGNYILALTAVLVLSAAAYLFWTQGVRGSSQVSTPSANSGRSSPVIPPAGPAVLEKQSPPPSMPTPDTPKAAITGEAQKSEAGGEQPATANTGSELTGEPATLAESGGRELETARRYLEGRSVPKDGAVAAFWLWKAVKKNNEQAVLLLSDLYMKGEDVPQSCAQARVLLTAAAKRGSREAAGKLADINSSSCR